LSYTEPSWSTIKTPRNDETSYFGSGNFVTRTDGKIIGSYYNYTDKKIYISYVDTEVDLLTNDCFSVNETVFETLVGNTLNNRRKRSHLFWTQSGKLQLYIYEPGDNTHTSYLKLYQSTTGNGDDFALLTTVNTITPKSKSGQFRAIMGDLGGVTQFGSRILVTYGFPKAGTGSYINYWMWGHYCSYSDDNGASWSGGYILWYGTDTGGYSRFTYGLGMGDDRLFCYVSLGASYNARTYYSDDSGVSWIQGATFVPPGGATSGTGCYCLDSPGDGYSYLGYYGVNVNELHIYRRSCSDVISISGQDPFGIGVGTAWPDLLQTVVSNANIIYYGSWMTAVYAYFGGRYLDSFHKDNFAIYQGVRDLITEGIFINWFHNGVWYLKPLKTFISSTWVDKPILSRDSTEWIDRSDG